MRTLLVGVAGGSCSGQSNLAALVVEELRPDGVARVSFDSYYRPLDHLTPVERDRVNFDHPDSLDEQLFVEHLLALRSGEGVQQPVYDFATHSRRSRTVRIESARVVVVDGILILASEAVRSLLDYTVFLDVPQHLRLERRIVRDISERGRTEQSVRRQFAESVAPMHEEFVQPGADHADLLAHHSDALGALARHVARVIRTHLSRPLG